MSNSMKVLWLANSTNLVAIGLLTALLALNLDLRNRALLALLALAPLASAALLYVFKGNFLPAHFMLLAAALIGSSIFGDCGTQDHAR